MGGVTPILRREYVERVRSKWFVFGTVAMPLFLAGLMVVPWLFASGGGVTERTIILVDETGVLSGRVAPRLEEGGFTVQVADPGALDSLGAEAWAGEGGYLVLGPETLRRGQMLFVGTQGPGLVGGMTMRSAVSQAALEVRLGDEGTREELESLLAGGAMEVRLLQPRSGGPSEGDPEFMGVFVGTMVLYMVILLYAVAVMRATMEEKTGRIAEILISSVRPGHLMLGKILGVGSVGLTQLAVWVGMGVLMVTLGLPALALARPEAMADPGFLAGALPGWGQAALFLALFLGGYFLYAGVYAAVGAMCSTEEEAQQAQFPVVILLVLPVLFLMPVMEDPGSTMAVVASLVPFFTPILLYARVGTGEVPLWEVLVALILLYGAVVAVAWVAGRIYRVGMLMQGKRPTLPELWRWVREA
jgi:ABC-2 type transport system permease protein